MGKVFCTGSFDFWLFSLEDDETLAITLPLRIAGFDRLFLFDPFRLPPLDSTLVSFILSSLIFSLLLSAYFEKYLWLSRCDYAPLESGTRLPSPDELGNGIDILTFG